MLERRAYFRHKTFIKGRIYFNNRLASHDCIIRDASEGGARLEFSENVTLPDRFELHIPSKDQYYQAQVRWRKANQIGISTEAAFVSDMRSDDSRPEPPTADRIAKLEYEVAILHKRLDALQRV